MEKMRMESPDLTAQNIEKIGALFPNCITESVDENGKPKKAINFELLKQMLSGDVIEGSEAYEFTWVGKKAAIVEANRPIRKTLRPCKEESVNWDTTENLYIEGDNLEVLKLLQESYLGAIKMIYIDPPYNTGNDFIYRDDFAVGSEQWVVDSGQCDDEGNRMFKNTDSNGRFHSDWCSMMYSRLLLARNLLSDDGAIFISIDDNEIDNLKKICDSVFGENNFVATFPWRKRTAKSDVPFGVSQDYEWIVCYAKSNEFVASVAGKERKYYETPDFPGRPWRVHDLTKQTTASERPNSFFTIVNPKTGEQYPANPNRTWAITEETFKGYYDVDRIVFPGDYDFLNIKKPVLRYWKADDMEKAGDNFGRVAVSTKLADDIGMSQDGTKEITNLFGGKVFSFPKPSSLIKFFASIHTDEDDIILDFFSGSAATAHAIMELNAEDNKARKFIIIQLPEPCDENSDAYKSGYSTICEIGKERIRRAGRLISGQLVVGKGQNGGDEDGGSKFQGIADMAKGHGDCEGDLFAGEETSKGRDLCFGRPNEKSGSVDSVEHSRGAVQKFNEGVYSFFGDSERVEGGAGNTTSSLQGNRLSNGRRNTTRDEFAARGEQNASCNESETNHSPLATTNYQLTTNHSPLDTGFRVFKLDETNMNDVYYSANEYSQDLLPMLESNVKADRTDLDLLFGCLLEWGLPLSLPYTSETIEGCTVHTYNDGDLIACFDENIPDSVVKAIAKRQPLRAVFRDSSFADSPSKINVGEVFKLLAPDTRVKVI